jgi:hypothetical protein
MSIGVFALNLPQCSINDAQADCTITAKHPKNFIDSREDVERSL